MQENWIQLCQNWKSQWRDDFDNNNYSDGINIYHLLKYLSNKIPDNSIIVSDAGSAFFAVSQSFKFKNNQRYITSGGQADMGFAIPAAIGAYFANPNRPISVITGDGSFVFNIQELQTIKYHNIPIKIFILNNRGFLSIRASQGRFFENRKFLCDKTNGIPEIDIEKVVKAYDICCSTIFSLEELNKCLCFNENIPYVYNVICPQNQQIIPTAGSKIDKDGKIESLPLDKMMPYL